MEPNKKNFAVFFAETVIKFSEAQLQLGTKKAQLSLHVSLSSARPGNRSGTTAEFLYDHLTGLERRTGTRCGRSKGEPEIYFGLATLLFHKPSKQPEYMRPPSFLVHVIPLFKVSRWSTRWRPPCWICDQNEICGHHNVATFCNFGMGLLLQHYKLEFLNVQCSKTKRWRTNLEDGV